MAVTKNRGRQLPIWVWLAVPLALYLIAAAVVNPLREYGFADDWAYALTVRGLLTTGTYKLHDFLGPSVPFLAYWGALFSAFFGFSFASLHLSTLVLATGGLAAFYTLAREHGLGPVVSGVLTLVFVASPLALEFSFTFMSDAPFMALVTITLALFTRGFRLKQNWLVFAGSIAGASAILVRQFGVAFIPALALLWFFSGQRRELAKLTIIAMAAPTAASIYQTIAGIVSPNWTANWMSQVEINYLSQHVALVPETLWRILVCLEYAALFCLPLLIPMATGFYRELKQTQNMSPRSPTYRLNLYSLVGLFVAILGIAAMGTLLLKKPGSMPLIPWNLDIISTWPRPVSSLLSIVVVIGAFLFGRLLVMRYAKHGGVVLSPHERLLDYSTLGMLALQLALYQFGDEYLLFLIPFALIVIGRGASEWIGKQLPVLAATSIVLLAVSTLWARGIINDLASQWLLAERLIAQGISPDDIYTASWEWNSYQGAFDDYLDTIRYTDGYQSQFGPYFTIWLPDRYSTAQYLIGPLAGDEDLSPWTVIDQESFTNSSLQTQTNYVLKRK